MQRVHVKNGDRVYILSGKDKAKEGKILAVDVANNRVKVEGINMLTKHMKPRSQMQPGGIIHEEGYIDASNVMKVCPACKVPAKFGKKFLDNGDKVSFCKKCNEEDYVISKGK